MAAYYREAVLLPQPGAAPPSRERPYYEGRRARYVPRTWNYLTALPSYWNHLLVDSLTWDAEPAERYRSWMRELNLEPPELHRRLAQRWQFSADLNTRGAARVKAALAASPPSGAAADLRFLADLFRAYQPLLEALRDYHAARAEPAAANAPGLIDAALAGAQSAEKLAESLFPQPVDPAMGEIRSLRHYPGKLAEAIHAWKESR
jgi:hypothetical protein